MLVGLMANYPKMAFCMIWILLFLAALLEISDWNENDLARKLFSSILGLLALVFLPYLFDYLNFFGSHNMLVTVGVGMLLVMILIITKKRSPIFNPVIKLVCSVLIAVFFFLIFLL